jgi:carbonic anhydrase
MHLFESIVEANHKAVAGDASAGLHPDEFAEELPIIALTCIDPRLNAFFPNILGIPADQFIWLRNAGNIITGPLSSTMRSLALACAVKGGKEIAIIGHTDCQVARTTTMQLLEKLKALGVDRSGLPDNLIEFFGLFATERQNVIKACDFVRQSPLIGPNIPVHGLLADIETGKLDWVVNGYEKLSQQQPQSPPSGALSQFTGLASLKDFDMGEMK